MKLEYWHHSQLERRARKMAAQAKKPMRILQDKARRDTVLEVKEVLKQFRLTPFEFEGACRHGLRESFCLAGHDWARADFEASELIREALMMIGAKRPTWIEGQPEYITPRENCQHCATPIPEEDRALNNRYCSDECRSFMATHRSTYHANVENWAGNMARYTKRRSERPAIACPVCKTEFKPSFDHVKVCSPSCAHKLRGNWIPPKKCAVCEKTFRNKDRNVRTCSKACGYELIRIETPPKDCEECGVTFKPARASATVCGDVCRLRKKNRRQKERRAKRVPFVCEAQ